VERPPTEEEILGLAEALGIASHRKTNVRFRQAYVEWRALQVTGSPSQEKFLAALLEHYETCPRKVPMGRTAQKFT
jgi:hypothetical protein